MGADIEMEVEESLPEPVGTIVTRSSRLIGVEVGSDLIPSMIDELPLIALAGSFRGRYNDCERRRGAEKERVGQDIRYRSELQKNWRRNP